MNLTQYAASRGMSKGEASKKKTKGIIIMGEGGQVDEAMSDANLKQLSVSRKVSEKKKETALDFGAPNESVDKTPHAELQRRLTAQKVLIAQHEAKEAAFNTALREGELLKAEDVSKRDADRCLGLQRRLLAIPSEHAITLHGLKTVPELADALRKVIKDALVDFLESYGIR